MHTTVRDLISAFYKAKQPSTEQLAALERCARRQIVSTREVLAKLRLDTPKNRASRFREHFLDVHFKFKVLNAVDVVSVDCFTERAGAPVGTFFLASAILEGKDSEYAADLTKYLKWQEHLK